MTKIKTISLQGKDYAQVKDRIKQFREDTSNGSITTESIYNPDGVIIVKATVVYDLSKPDSKRATGQAFGKTGTQKAFEKLETIAVGRALAFLGYAADGEIASSDEMEEFIAYQDNKKQEAISKLESTKNIEELKTIFLSLGNLMSDKEILAKTNELKLKLK
jgi:hypothetical protein